MAFTSTDIQKAYVAFFNRPADPAGLKYWTDVANASGNLNAVYQEFAKSAEYTAMYANKGVYDVINTIYNNIFGHDADVPGLMYWADLLTANKINVGNMVVAVAGGAQGSDKVAFDSKVAASAAFVAALDTAPELIAYSGDAANLVTKSWLAGVTDAATLATAVTNIDTTVAAVVAVHNEVNKPDAMSFSLTSAADLGAKFLGGAGDDMFVGAVIGGGTSTLNPGDSLTGGAGDDTLQVAISGDNNGATVSSVATAGIEKLMVSNYDINGAGVTLNLAQANGLKSISVSGSSTTGDTFITNLNAVVDASMENGSGDLSIDYIGAVEDTIEVQNLTLNNATGVTFTVDYAPAIAITTTGGASSVTIADAGEETITVKGDQNLTLAVQAGSLIKKLDASTLTGNLKYTDVGGTSIAITGGAGNDTITGTFTSTDTVTGGAGTDTLVISAAISATNAAKITGFETLSISGAAGAVSQAWDAVAGITLANIGANSNNNVTLTSLSDTAAVTVSSSTSGNVVLSHKTDTTTNAVTVNVNGGTAGAVTVANLDVSDSETVSLTSGGTSGNVVTALNLGSATKTLNVAASKSLTVSSGTWAALNKLDASTSTANVTFSAALSTAATITGGAGNDTFTGSTGGDSVVGGAGNDVLNGGGGKDSIDGGAGADTIVTTGSGNDVLLGGTGNDTITSATGNDNIDAGDGDDLINFTASTFAAGGEMDSNDTITGGAGTDYIQLTGAGATIDLSSTSMTNFQNIAGVEGIRLNTTSGSTLRLGDVMMGAFANDIKVTMGTSTAGAYEIDASGILNSSSKVTFTGRTGIVAQYDLGNGVDTVTMSDAADIFTLSNGLFLQSTDSLNGGDGADKIVLAAGTTGMSLSAAQMGTLKSVETVEITSGSGAVTVALNDAIVTANKTLGVAGTFTVNATGVGTGKITADGSSVTTGLLSITGASGNDALQGGAGNDTLVGAAGNDTLKGNAGDDNLSGGTGADALTGGTGSDTFSYVTADLGGLDTIADFDFGTSSSFGDIFAFNAGGGWQSAAVIAKASAGSITANAQIVVLNTATYADVAAVNTAVATGGAFAQTGTGHSLILWQDSLGNVHVSYDADGATTGGVTDVAILSGVSIVGVAGVVDITDFALS